ncbi:hypothetical protein ACFL6N_03525 [Thermodesulfobacteriota bacterium]
MKRKLSRLYPFVIMMLVLLIPQHATAQTKLLWNTFLLPGYYNEDGLPKGIADKILDYYISQLPTYDHEILEAPIVRIYSTMVETTEGGYLGPGKTKLPPHQLDRILTSSVHLVMPPAGIVIRKKDAATFFQGGTAVSVRSLLTGSRPLVFCWISGATYHPAIRQAVEEYVAAHPKHPNVHFWSNIRKEIYDMLLQERIDYFPNHAVSFQYECAKRQDCQEQLMFVPVTEAREDVLTYTFAAKTSVGREVVAKINAVHRSEEYKTLLKKLILQYYPPDLVGSYVEKNMKIVGTEMR